MARAGAGLLLVLVALPLISLALTLRPEDLSAAAQHGLWQALWLSLGSTTGAIGILVVLGTPLAWWLAREDSRTGRAVETLVRLPAVTPPAVAGVALLSAFGRHGVFGGVLDSVGVSLPFSTAAVVIAQIFVAAPFYVLPLEVAFGEVDEDMLWTARSLGASPARVFFRIALPLAMPSLLSGLAVAWARALGEFGATLVFAGNLPGTTQTLPIAIYAAMEGDLGPARAMAVVLLGLAVLLFVVLRSRPLARMFGRSR